MRHASIAVAHRQYLVWGCYLFVVKVFQNLEPDKLIGSILSFFYPYSEPGTTTLLTHEEIFTFCSVCNRHYDVDRLRNLKFPHQKLQCLGNAGRTESEEFPSSRFCKRRINLDPSIRNRRCFATSRQRKCHCRHVQQRKSFQRPNNHQHQRQKTRVGLLYLLYKNHIYRNRPDHRVHRIVFVL